MRIFIITSVIAILNFTAMAQDRKDPDSSVDKTITQKSNYLYLAISGGASGYGKVWIGEAKGVSATLRLETAYFLKNGFGAGLIFNGSQCYLKIKDKTVLGKDITVKLDDLVEFFGPALYKRFGSNRLTLKIGAGVGILFSNRQIRGGFDDITYDTRKYEKWGWNKSITGGFITRKFSEWGWTKSTAGGFISAGGNYMLTQNFGVILNIQSTLGSIIEDNIYVTRNPTALGCTLGINFRF